MNLERKTTRLQIKGIEDSGTFGGYASVFSVMDEGNDIVLPGAFAGTLQRHKEAGTSPALLWQHDTREPIGVWEEMSEDDHGLRGTGRLLIDDDPLAKRAHAHLKAKSVSGLSIGFSIVDSEYKGDTRLIKEVELWETSIVTFPMNRSARIDSVKESRVITKRDTEAWLRDSLGLSRKEAMAFIAGGWDSFMGQRESGDDLKAAVNVLNKLRSES